MKRLLCTFVFIIWRQIYKLYQSSDYNAESKFPLFMELAFIEKLKFLSNFFYTFCYPNPCQKINLRMHQFAIENFKAL